MDSPIDRAQFLQHDLGCRGKTVTISSAKSRLAARLVLDIFARGSFFLLTLFLARRLGTGSFGTLAYAMSTAQIFYVFTDLGIQLQMMADPGTDSQGHPKWVSYYSLKLKLLAVTFIGGSMVGYFLWKSTAPYWIFISGLLWMSGNSVFDFQQAVCNTLGDMVSARRILILQRGIFLIVIFPLVWFLPSVKAAALSLAGISLMASIISHLSLMRRLNAQFSDTPLPWKSILKVSFPNAIGSAFYLWGLRISVVILAWESTKESVGAYAASVRIFEMSYVIPAAVMAIGLPHLSTALYIGKNEFWRRWRRYAALLSAIGFLWALGFLIFSDRVVSLLFGSGYMESIPSMKVLGIAGGLVIVNHLFNHTMVAIGHQKRLAASFVAGFMVCLMLCIILISSQNAFGAALAVLITELFLSLLVGSYLILHRHKIFPVGQS